MFIQSPCTADAPEKNRKPGIFSAGCVLVNLPLPIAT